MAHNPVVGTGTYFASANGISTSQAFSAYSDSLRITSVGTQDINVAINTGAPSKPPTDFDYVILDFLGDVVCGGFGLPIARDMAQKVIVVCSNALQSLYVANNVCSAVEYFRKLGGSVGVA